MSSPKDVRELSARRLDDGLREHKGIRDPNVAGRSVEFAGDEGERNDDDGAI